MKNRYSPTDRFACRQITVGSTQVLSAGFLIISIIRDIRRLISGEIIRKAPLRGLRDAPENPVIPHDSHS